MLNSSLLLDEVTFPVSFLTEGLDVVFVVDLTSFFVVVAYRDWETKKKIGRAHV